MATDDNANNHLWKLPPELREQIYLFAFATTETSQGRGAKIFRTELRVDGDIVLLTASNSRRHNERGSHAIGLLSTCRAIYHEAIPTLYASAASEQFLLRMGCPPSQSYYHDLAKDVNMGLIGDCRLLRHVKLVNVHIDLRTVENLDYLVEHQLPRVIKTVRDVSRLEIWWTMVVFWPPVPEERDQEVLDALRPLVGDGIDRITRGREDEDSRRYRKVTPR